MNKNLLMKLALAGLSAMGMSAQIRMQDRPEVLVRVADKANVPSILLLPAEGNATKIFAQIGVRVKWAHMNDVEATVALDPACPRQRNLRQIELVLTGNTPENDHKMALAFALPYASGGVRVTVFYDRVSRRFEHCGGWSAAILGHVMAHEIAHVLLGTLEHSEDGLMRATWKRNEFGEMVMRPLPFTGDMASVILWNLNNENRPSACGQKIAANRNLEDPPQTAWRITK